MSSKLKAFCIWLVASLAVGIATTPLAPDRLREEDEELNLAALSGGVGEGITIVALGGYRNIAANLVWISMYSDWQRRRPEAVLGKIGLAVALSPKSLYFWIDGARIIANDMPVWEVGDDLMDSLFQNEEGIATRQRYGDLALRFLNQAPASLSDSVPILLEKGTIYWRRMGNLEEAAGYFAQAASKKGAPYFISRVYAELLVRQGRTREAYEYLKDHYAGLPDEDPRALKPFVANRIRQLEQELEGSGD